MKLAIVLLLGMGTLGCRKSAPLTEGYVWLSNGSGGGIIAVTCPASVSNCGTIHVVAGNWYIERFVRPVQVPSGYLISADAKDGCYHATGKIDCANAGWPECISIDDGRCADSGGHYFESDEGGPDKKRIR